MGPYSDILRTLAATGQRFVVPTHLSAMRGIAARLSDDDGVATPLRIDPSIGSQDDVK